MLQAIARLFSSTPAPLAASEVASSKLTYLPEAKLENISRSIDEVQRTGVRGAFVEFGVALGGSGIFICRKMDRRRKFIGFDLFGMIPAPGAKDDEKSHQRYAIIASGKSDGIGGDRYYGYEPDLLGKVKESFASYGAPVDGRRIRLIPGLFEETLPKTNLGDIAFAHIDCDWFDPVTLCLETVYKNLSIGGVIILDDYNDYGGCKRATDEFLGRHRDIKLLDSTHNAVLRREAI
ncbi:TylF/MycF/NovP-related O-methyltransferase [Caballeronia insecticola]|uniref:TylF/MycF/NovP-related O-methyltransferase n=1 Tax=Caballeronia insecticola TaxID=758793 RepID=UPI001360B55F|nr:TylF/MycF/NovP-related O-methyltransferase [Caballeronia insecticola]